MFIGLSELSEGYERGVCQQGRGVYFTAWEWDGIYGRKLS